jgi:flagellin-like protein
MKRLTSALRRIHREERGITGLETAIILIAFVVVATIFAFVVLTTGIFSSERGKETVYAGLQKARGTMEVRGGVVASATGSPLAVDKISFAVATTAGGPRRTAVPTSASRVRKAAFTSARVAS